MATSSYYLRKLGTLNLNFGPSPFDFNSTQASLGPRFFNADGTGGFFGLAGYYTAVPSWNTNPYEHIQRLYGFTLNPLGIFDVKMTEGSIPFNNQSTSFQTDGSLAWTGNNPNTFSVVALGLNGLYSCYGGPGTGLGAQYYGPLTKSIIPAFPPLSFEPLDTTFSSKQLITPSWYNGAGTGGYPGLSQRPTAVLIDTLYGEIVTGCQPGGVFTPGTSPFDGYIRYPSTAQIYYTFVNTANGSRAFYNFPNPTGGGSFKVNPLNGNMIATWSGVNGDSSSSYFLYMLNSFCEYEGTGQAGNTSIQGPNILQAHFSDPADEAVIWTGGISTLEYGWVYQIPGGGFFVAPNTSPNVAVLIAPDFSGYYRVNIIGASLPQFGGGYSEDCFGVDLNGNAYILQYNGSTYQKMVTTLNEGSTLILQDPPLLTAQGINCRVFNECNLSFEG